MATSINIQQPSNNNQSCIESFVFSLTFPYLQKQDILSLQLVNKTINKSITKMANVSLITNRFQLQSIISPTNYQNIDFVKLVNQIEVTGVQQKIGKDIQQIAQVCSLNETDRSELNRILIELDELGLCVPQLQRENLGEDCRSEYQKQLCRFLRDGKTQILTDNSLIHFLENKFDDLYQEVDQYIKNTDNLSKLLKCRWQLEPQSEGPLLLRIVSLFIMSIKNLVEQFFIIITLFLNESNILQIFTYCHNQIWNHINSNIAAYQNICVIFNSIYARCCPDFPQYPLFSCHRIYATFFARQFEQQTLKKLFSTFSEKIIHLDENKDIFQEEDELKEFFDSIMDFSMNELNIHWIHHSSSVDEYPLTLFIDNLNSTCQSNLLTLQNLEQEKLLNKLDWMENILNKNFVLKFAYLICDKKMKKPERESIGKKLYDNVNLGDITEEESNQDEETYLDQNQFQYYNQMIEDKNLQSLDLKMSKSQHSSSSQSNLLNSISTNFTINDLVCSIQSAKSQSESDQFTFNMTQSEQEQSLNKWFEDMKNQQKLFDSKIEMRCQDFEIPKTLSAEMNEFYQYKGVDLNKLFGLRIKVEASQDEYLSMGEEYNSDDEMPGPLSLLQNY